MIHHFYNLEILIQSWDDICGRLLFLLRATDYVDVSRHTT